MSTEASHVWATHVATVEDLHIYNKTAYEQHNCSQIHSYILIVMLSLYFKASVAKLVMSYNSGSVGIDKNSEKILI